MLRRHLGLRATAGPAFTGVRTTLLGIALFGTALVGIALVGAPAAAAALQTEEPDDGAPAEEPTAEAPPEDPETPEGEAPAEPDDVTSEREDISGWWIIAAVVAGTVAVWGIIYSLRRRDEDEAWLRRAATACDTGRGALGSVSRIVDTSQQIDPAGTTQGRLSRFEQQLDELADTAPNERAKNTIGRVQAAIELVAEAAATPDPQTRGDKLEVSLAGLRDALGELEREVSVRSIEADHPSSRPSA